MIFTNKGGLKALEDSGNKPPVLLEKNDSIYFVTPKSDPTNEDPIFYGTSKETNITHSFQSNISLSFDSQDLEGKTEMPAPPQTQASPHQHTNPTLSERRRPVAEKPEGTITLQGIATITTQN